MSPARSNDPVPPGTRAVRPVGAGSYRKAGLLQSYVGPRDPQGTHNIVFFGGNGASAYTASIDFGPGTNFVISGIFYVPKYTITSHGNPTMQFNGQVTVASYHISGGGGSPQVISWVCGIGVVLGNPAVQGGINR